MTDLTDTGVPSTKLKVSVNSILQQESSNPQYLVDQVFSCLKGICRSSSKRKANSWKGGLAKIDKEASELNFSSKEVGNSSS